MWFPKTLILSGFLKKAFFKFYITAPPQKMPYYLPFTKNILILLLSLIINLLDHLQVWCKLSRAWPLAELKVV